MISIRNYATSILVIIGLLNSCSQPQSGNQAEPAPLTDKATKHIINEVPDSSTMQTAVEAKPAVKKQVRDSIRPQEAPVSDSIFKSLLKGYLKTGQTDSRPGSVGNSGHTGDRTGSSGGSGLNSSTWSYNFIHYKCNARIINGPADGEGSIVCRVSVDCNNQFSIIQYGSRGTTYTGTLSNMQLLFDQFMSNATFTRIDDHCPETGLVTLIVKSAN